MIRAGRKFTGGGYLRHYKPGRKQSIRRVKLRVESSSTSEEGGGAAGASANNPDAN